MVSKTLLDGKAVQVTFRMPPLEGVSELHLCGDFNGWNPTAAPLARQEDGSWTVTVVLEPGRSYRYRFRDGEGRWHNDWNAEAYVPNSFGSEDSVVVVDAPAAKRPVGKQPAAKKPAKELAKKPAEKTARKPGKEAGEEAGQETRDEITHGPRTREKVAPGRAASGNPCWRAEAHHHERSSCPHRALVPGARGGVGARAAVDRRVQLRAEHRGQPARDVAGRHVRPPDHRAGARVGCRARDERGAGVPARPRLGRRPRRVPRAVRAVPLARPRAAASARCPCCSTTAGTPIPRPGRSPSPCPACTTRGGCSRPA